MADAVAEPSKALHWEREYMQTKRLLDNLWKKKFFHFLVATHSPPTDPLASFLCRLIPGGSFISVAIPSTGEKQFFGVSAGSGLAKLCSRQGQSRLAKDYKFLPNCTDFSPKLQNSCHGKKNVDNISRRNVPARKSWLFDTRISRHVPNRIA